MKKLTLMQKRAISGLLFVLPFIVGFCIFYIRSIIMTVNFSISDVEVIKDSALAAELGRGYTTKFCGWDNFYYLFRVDNDFTQILLNSISAVVVDIFLILCFSLLMAIMLNQKFFGRSLVRAIFFLPVILNGEAIADALAKATEAIAGGVTVVSAEMSSASSGTSNVDFYMSLFKELAFPDKLLDYVVGAVSRLSSVVSLSGVQIVIFIAALQSIPGSLYEVAKIEGATTYETFWKVTFPMVSPHIVTNVVYTVVDSYTNSEVNQFSYDLIFGEKLSYAYGSASILLSAVLVCIILLVICGLISKRAFYYN